MSEFKYACPVCGQHISCDSSQAGAQMECPTCFQKITVPQAPSSEGQKFIITGTKKGERPAPTNPEANPYASPQAKGFPGALVVVIILLFIGAAVAFVYRGTIFKSINVSKTAANSTMEETNPVPAKTQKPPDGFPPEMLPNGTGNIALHKPSLAGSSEKLHLPQDGSDGNLATRWCASSASVPQWWEVDLGAMATITNTQVAWEHDGVHQYKIETSLNHTNWTTAANQTRNSISSRVSADSFSASGRYVRITVTGLQHGSWASFYEFQAFGSGG